MGRGKVELLYALPDQKPVGFLFWEDGNKLPKSVKQFLRLGWLVNVMVLSAKGFITRCKGFHTNFADTIHMPE